MLRKGHSLRVKQFGVKPTKSQITQELNRKRIISNNKNTPIPTLPEGVTIQKISDLLDQGLTQKAIRDKFDLSYKKLQKAIR